MAWTRANLLRNGTKRLIIRLNLRQQFARQFPEPLVIMLIAHGFENLNGDLGAPEMIA
jgi:hypothetical protein